MELKNFEQMKSEITCANVIKNTLQKFYDLKKEPRYDKMGKGFNTDSRFSAAKVTISIDSWSGVYGDSGCSRVIQIPDEKLFQKNFIEVLNENFDSLLTKTADKILKKATTQASKAKDELTGALDQVNAMLGDKQQ